MTQKRDHRMSAKELEGPPRLSTMRWQRTGDWRRYVRPSTTLASNVAHRLNSFPTTRLTAPAPTAFEMKPERLRRVRCSRLVELSRQSLVRRITTGRSNRTKRLNRRCPAAGLFGKNVDPHLNHRLTCTSAQRRTKASRAAEPNALTAIMIGVFSFGIRKDAA